MASVFERPTIEALASLVDGTVERPVVGAELQPRARGIGEPAYAGLSSTERRLWFLHRLTPEARSYQVPQVFRIKGVLKEEALRESLSALAMRHEVLRTRYPEEAGAPVRGVGEEASISLRFEDISGLPAATRETAVRALIAEEVALAFELARGPLTRVIAITTSAEEHVVVMHQHHIVTDEWSSGILLRDWSAL
jgi:hypothetical protein